MALTNCWTLKIEYDLSSNIERSLFLLHNISASITVWGAFAIMGRISQIFTASLAVFGSAAASAVIDLKPDNFDGTVKPVEVLFEQSC